MGDRMPPMRRRRLRRINMFANSRVDSCDDPGKWDMILEEKKDKWVVAYFSADWCGPCRFIYPVVEGLAQDHKDKVSFIKIDVDKAWDIARHWRVVSLPTFLLIKNKEEKKRIEGAMKEQLQDAVSDAARESGSTSTT